MKVILKSDFESLGKMGDVVRVSDGYARNFLIPKGFAAEASDRNIRTLDHQKQVIAKKAEKEKRKAEETQEKLKDFSCTIYRRSGDQNKLFGSVSSKDIEKALADQGIRIERKDIVIEEPIRTLGDYTIKVKLYPGMTASVSLKVAEEQQ
ncbi:MAG TPA: 50S ribosomal protein L9 [Syntrophales bacterium]|nr:50S ribosomal protein L9 [Syntrophales bacterium]